jgi:hypothetical protein
MALAACKKNGDDNNPVIDTTSTTMVYSIGGVSDVKIASNGYKAELPLAIALTSGFAEKVTLSLSGLPDNVKHEFTTPAGLPTYKSTLTIRSHDAAPGTYPVTLSGATAANTKKNVNFNLVIDNPTDCTTTMAGNYTAGEHCSASTTVVVNVAATIDNMPNVMILDGIAPIPIAAKFNCGTGTLTLVENSFTDSNGFHSVFTGAGSFSEATKTIKLTIFNTADFQGGHSVTTSCIYTLAR